jgi:formylglycine-generating enzyme required for sulfatase activity/tRNA A-37 threonylcarbamoyl transferase component Bud32
LSRIDPAAAIFQDSRNLTTKVRTSGVPMLEPDVTQLLDAIYDLELLPAKQMEEVVGPLRQQFKGPKELAAECVRRGWLTEFQSERLLAAQGQSLILGPYELLARLGQGGMGEVFKARHRLLNRVVALKITRKELLTDPTNERRFLREIRATARLKHPNIVTVHDASCIGDTHFFAMEYIEGADLARLVKQQGPLPVRKACEYIRQAALGLQHAYEQGMVHRDIKPSNLLVTADGTVVKILDMGVARCRDAEGSDLTATGSVVGTPDYLAPEQATNSSAVDIRADIYSLGCTLYHLLAGHAPFPEGSSLEKALKHLHDQPSPIRTQRADVPPELAVVLEKMMEKKPAARYQQPVEIAQALASFCSVAAPALPAAPSKPPEPKPARSRRKSRKFLAAGVLMAITGLGIGYWQPWADTTESRKQPYVNSIGMEFVWIPAGEFEMGSPEDERGRGEDEGPVHTVTISRPFFLASKETTKLQFQLFVNDTRFKTEAELSGEGAQEWDPDNNKWQQKPNCKWNSPGGLQDRDHPVVCISRRDAEAFCQWLSNREHRNYRLPTEAEWEYACRAGTTTPYGTGEVITPETARFAPKIMTSEEARRRLRTQKIGAFAPNDWGLFDMHGNVWEWCADFYSPNYYQESQKIDPVGPKLTEWLVVRGGSWQSSDSSCRAAARLAVSERTSRNDIGFRVLLEAGVR